MWSMVIQSVKRAVEHLKHVLDMTHSYLTRAYHMSELFLELETYDFVVRGEEEESVVLAPPPTLLFPILLFSKKIYQCVLITTMSFEKKKEKEEERKGIG